MVMMVKAHSFEGHPDDWADETLEQYEREQHIRADYRAKDRQRVIADGLWGVQTRRVAELARKGIVPSESIWGEGYSVPTVEPQRRTFSFPSTSTMMQIIGWGGTVVSLIVWAWP